MRTLAERNARGRRVIDRIKGEIREILVREARPLDQPVIEFYLMKLIMDRDGNLDAMQVTSATWHDTFHVCQAISDLEKAGEIREVGIDKYIRIPPLLPSSCEYRETTTP